MVHGTREVKSRLEKLNKDLRMLKDRGIGKDTVVTTVKQYLKELADERIKLQATVKEDAEKQMKEKDKQQLALRQQSSVEKSSY